MELIDKAKTKCGHCQGTGIHTLDGFCWWCYGKGYTVTKEPIREQEGSYENNH